MMKMMMMWRVRLRSRPSHEVFFSWGFFQDKNQMKAVDEDDDKDDDKDGDDDDDDDVECVWGDIIFAMQHSFHK